MPAPRSSPPLWMYRALLVVGATALALVGWAYRSGAAVEPLAGRLAIGLATLALAVVTVTSGQLRQRGRDLTVALFGSVSAWQISLAAESGLTPTTAFGVLLVFLGCSAVIQASRPLAVYVVLFVGATAAAAWTVPAPGVPLGGFLATLGALGVLGLVVARAQERAIATLRVAKEEALTAARAKAEFLATMSHEIRTPLNGVIGMTDILAETPLSADQRDYVGTIQASGRALLGVINDVLDFSKIEAGRLELDAEPVDLRALADDAVAVVAPAATEKGLEAVCHVEPSVPGVVLGDGARLRQILLNLLSNAVKFTPSGTVALRIDATRGWGPAAVRIRVSDTGIGVAPADLETLFESFTQVDASATRRFGGTGLGLAITKRLTEAMGGAITVTSAVGEGSVFEVALPMPEVEGPPAPGGGGATLLLVEPHDGARAALAMLAEAHGAHVVALSDATAAHAFVADGGRYDVALIALGDGASGLALADRLRSEPRVGGRPLVLLAPLGSAIASPELFDAVLPKPVRADRFADVLGRLTGAPQPEPAAPPAPTDIDAETPLRVLVVEDHEVNRRVAVGLLARLGVSPDVAVDGAQALDALRVADYDLVLMDIQMPVLDGLEATRRLRAERPSERQPRVVALTANAFSDDAARCREAGMDGFLAKPIRMGELRAEIGRTRAALSGAAPAAPAPQATPQAPPTLGEATPDGVAGHLRALAEGDVPLALEILDAYLRTADALADALADGDTAEAAHKLLAACGTLGADRLAHAAHTVERAARAGADVADDARALADDLRAFRTVAEAARATLGAPSQAGSARVSG